MYLSDEEVSYFPLFSLLKKEPFFKKVIRDSDELVRFFCISSALLAPGPLNSIIGHYWQGWCCVQLPCIIITKLTAEKCPQKSTSEVLTMLNVFSMFCCLGGNNAVKHWPFYSCLSNVITQSSLLVLNSNLCFIVL